MSSKRQQDLKYKCELNKKPQNKVVLPIDIRWNSELNMCETALKMKKSITNISEMIDGETAYEAAHDSENWGSLDENDWKKAQLAIDLLEPYHQSKILFILKF